jgi:hypothetical protein
MSCYFRHIKDILQEARIDFSGSKKKQVDQVIHHMLGVSYKDCPETWKRLKQRLSNEEERRELIRPAEINGIICPWSPAQLPRQR